MIGLSPFCYRASLPLCRWGQMSAGGCGSIHVLIFWFVNTIVSVDWRTEGRQGSTSEEPLSSPADRILAAFDS